MPDNALAGLDSQVDNSAIDALFKRIVDRGRKVRAQSQENLIPIPQTVKNKQKLIQPFEREVKEKKSN